jgi:hypothetical protein
MSISMGWSAAAHCVGGRVSYSGRTRVPLDGAGSLCSAWYDPAASMSESRGYCSQ